MRFQEIPEFEKSLKIDVDGFKQCPSCDFESKLAHEVSDHFEVEHED